MSHLAPISMKVQSTIPAYYIVTNLTGTANTVKVPGGITELPIGITADTVLDTTSAIPVIIGGIAKCYFNDSCASGCLVASNNAGQAVPYVNNTAGGYVIGTLVGPTVNTTGTIEKVLIQPMWKIIT